MRRRSEPLSIKKLKDLWRSTVHLIHLQDIIRQQNNTDKIHKKVPRSTTTSVTATTTLPSGSLDPNIKGELCEVAAVHITSEYGNRTSFTNNGGDTFHKLLPPYRRTVPPSSTVGYANEHILCSLLVALSAPTITGGPAPHVK